MARTGTRAIAIIGYRRPALFAQLLHSLRANDLAGWRIEIQLEPSDVADEFSAVAAQVLGSHDYAIRVNRNQLGIRMNGHSLLDRLFTTGTELCVYLEEDLVVSPDVCALAGWYAANHRPHWLCLSLVSAMCGSAGILSDPRHPELLFESRAFNSLGFALRRQEWDRCFRQSWLDRPSYLCSTAGSRTEGWDWSIFQALAHAPNLQALHPVAARSRHTGREGGVNCSPEFHDRAFARLAIHEAATPINYRVTRVGALPDPVRGHAILADELIWAWRALLRRDRNPGRHALRRLREAALQLRSRPDETPPAPGGHL